MNAAVGRAAERAQEGERARLFVALELPEPVPAALDQWRTDRLGAVPGLRMVGVDDLHVTLCFLGPQPTAEIDSIAAACMTLVGCGRPVLSVGDPAWLPPRRPRVLAVDLDDRDGALGQLQAKLARSLEVGGWYAPERRPFRAHVTVARVAHRARVTAIDVPQPAPITFVGSHVVLMRSRLGRAGARYEQLASVVLDSATARVGGDAMDSGTARAVGDAMDSATARAGAVAQVSRADPTAGAASRPTSPAPGHSRS